MSAFDPKRTFRAMHNKGKGLDSRERVVLLESPQKDVTSRELVRGAIEPGLRWPTPYWPELAVRWLEEGAALDSELVKLVDAVASNDHFPQGLRHRAFALARWFDRTQGSP